MRPVTPAELERSRDIQQKSSSSLKACGANALYKHVPSQMSILFLMLQAWRFFTFTFFHLQFLDLFQNLLTLLDTLDVEAGLA